MPYKDPNYIRTHRKKTQVNVPTGEYARWQKFVADNGFGSMSQFIREAVNLYIDDVMEDADVARPAKEANSLHA